jgi:VIT1/CCC1 family predicted Fe2+/Mn2+ transporter
MATREEAHNSLRERPLGEVARELTSDLSLLARQEIDLAKAEMAQKGRTAAPGVAMLGGAGAVALCAAGALTAFLVLVLSLVLPDWAAALIVAAALGGVAYLLITLGKARLERAGKPVPQQTIETMKEDVEWATTRASSARR